jgi:hypothetical protein
MACNKVLPCGHPCCGFRGESYHTPCLFEECADRVKKDKSLLY